MFEDIVDRDLALSEDEYYDALLYLLGDAYPDLSEEELEDMLDDMLDRLPERDAENVMESVEKIAKKIGAGALKFTADNPELVKTITSATGAMIGGPIGSKIGGEVGKFAAQSAKKQTLPNAGKMLALMQDPQVLTAVTRTAMGGIRNGTAPLTKDGKTLLIPAALYFRSIIDTAQKALMELDQYGIIPSPSLSEALPYSDDVDLQAEWLAEQLTSLDEGVPLGKKLDNVKKWEHLLLFKVPDDIVAYLAQRSMKIQYAHNESYSNELNTDNYCVLIRRLPSFSGKRITHLELKEHIRLNINDFLDTSIARFYPYDASIDAPIWQSSSPVRAVIRINMADDAAVVVSKATKYGWIFTTIHTPATGNHPVSGHRMFTVAESVDKPGIHYFVIQGLDMMSRGVAGLGLPVAGSYGFKQAHKLWSGMTDKVIDFINSNGGRAERCIDFDKTANYSERIDWRFVYRRYGEKLEKVFGKNAGSASNSPFWDF